MRSCGINFFSQLNKQGTLRVYTGTGEIMSKAEQIFKTVDFSVETDLKERLRKQLFENREIKLSEKGSRDNSDNDGSKVVGNVGSGVGSSAGRNAGGRRSSARQLSFDELDLVNAAGSIAMQQDSSGKAKPAKPKDPRGKNPWSNPFSGNILDNDKE